MFIPSTGAGCGPRGLSLKAVIFRMFLSSVFIPAVLLSGGCVEKGEQDYILSLTYPEIRELAENSEVSFYMWGGDPSINRWVQDYLVPRVLEEAGIVLKPVFIRDAADFVEKLAAEKVSGIREGTADLVWINGENFRNARIQGLLTGPYTHLLPNMKKYVEPRFAETDFGFSVDGYETPYGRAQFVFEYDSHAVIEPPRSYEELRAWIIAHPGRFTYPKPPDFTGSAFIRQAFYELSTGYEPFLERSAVKILKPSLVTANTEALWEYLKEIEPYLWREGREYPENVSRLVTLFVDGEVDFCMFYNPNHAAVQVRNGIYRDSVRTFVMRRNSLSNTNFTAIPFNAPNKAGALVLSNILISPEVQLSKADPAGWGGLPILDFSRLEEEHKIRFSSMERGVAALPFTVLSLNAVPEIPPGYVELLEVGWQEHFPGR